MCNPNPDLDLFNAGFDTAKVNVIFLLDTSSSMKKFGRIRLLNDVMLIAFATADEVCNDLGAELSIRVIQFNSDARYIIGTPERGASYEEAVNNWKDLGVSSGTRTDLAVEEALKCMRAKYLGTNNYQPVVFLITDGYSDDYDISTNDAPDTNKAFDRLANCLKNSKGESRVKRVGLEVQDANRAQLERFASTAIFTDEDGHEVEAPIVAEVQAVGGMMKYMLECLVEPYDYPDIPPEIDEWNEKMIMDSDSEEENYDWIDLLFGDCENNIQTDD